ncbi:MAG: DNA primase [Deltaproteobacteria bacterium]|nr:DNA primase [Deltaproteobacteria bacterium]
MKTAVDTILEKVDIVEFISRYVRLKKTGRNFVGLCPFHKEKTPSFTVSPEKQLFYCFGCQTGGNVISFVMKYENMDFHDAIESLSKEYGIPVQEWKVKTFAIYDALSELAEFYHKNLKQSQIALRYLRERDIDNETIDKFKLGFSGKNISEFFSSCKIPKDVFFSTGILKITGTEIQDIFRGRIVIPIYDVNGRVIGFGGRSIEKDRLPKYINSPESQVFSKRSVLFGLEKAKRDIVDKNLAIIVEGYFDMISLYNCGIKNVVASLGTAITEEQIKKLKNYTENITLMLDSDEAGIKSALRAIDTFSANGVNGEIVLLPQNEDPDTFARKNGYSGISALIQKRMPIIEYYFEYHKEKYGMETVQKKLSFIRTVMPYIEQMRDNVHKRLYVKRISELTGVEEHIFWDEIEGKSKNIEFKEEERILPPVNKMLIGTILDDPELAYGSGLREVVDYIKDGTLKRLMEEFFATKMERDVFDLNGYLFRLENEDIREFVVSGVFEAQRLEKDAKRKIIEDFIKYTKKSAMKEKLKMLTERLAFAEREKDEKKISEILIEKKEVLKALKSS